MDHRVRTYVVFQVRTVIRKSFKAALDENDILISPAAPSAAYRIGGQLLQSPTSCTLQKLVFLSYVD